MIPKSCAVTSLPIEAPGSSFSELSDGESRLALLALDDGLKREELWSGTGGDIQQTHPLSSFAIIVQLSWVAACNGK